MEYIAKKCISIVLKNEGGYVNHKSDPGGETKYGISDIADGIIDGAYNGIDISKMTKDQAVDIYYYKYWQPMNLHLIEDENLKLQIFDMGVNAGYKTAIKLLQRYLELKPDGIIGNITSFAVNGKFTAEQYKELRRNYYNNLVRKNQKYAVFINGWLNRVEKTKL